MDTNPEVYGRKTLRCCPEYRIQEQRQEIRTGIKRCGVRNREMQHTANWCFQKVILKNGTKAVIREHHNSTIPPRFWHGLALNRYRGATC